MEKAHPGSCQRLRGAGSRHARGRIVDFSEGRVAEMIAKPVMRERLQLSAPLRRGVLGVGYKFNDFIQPSTASIASFSETA